MQVNRTTQRMERPAALSLVRMWEEGWARCRGCGRVMLRSAVPVVADARVPGNEVRGCDRCGGTRLEEWLPEGRRAGMIAG